MSVKSYLAKVSLHERDDFVEEFENKRSVGVLRRSGKARELSSDTNATMVERKHHTRRVTATSHMLPRFKWK